MASADVVVYCASCEVREPVAKKKAEHIGAKKKARSVTREGKPAVPRVFTDLSAAEKDLVSHLEQGRRLESDSLGGNPVLRDPKSDEVIRAMSCQSQ